MTDSGAELAQRAELAIRTVPRVADANASGDIFGGWILAQMDIAGGTVAAQRAGGRVVTVAINAMTFHRPILIGDLVSVFAEVVKVGRTSLSVGMVAIARRGAGTEEVTVTEGTFVYVAIDEQRKPRPVDK